MSIDWFTFWAQVVNFVILVLLLRVFLYGPVTAAIDRREERIRERRDQAEEARRRAEREAGEYRARQEELEARRDELIREAEAEARRVQRELEQEAREEAAESRRRWERSVRREREALLSELRERVAEHAVGATRELVRHLADRTLEAEAVRTFRRRLEGLGEEEVHELAAAVQEVDGVLRVETRFELEVPEREALTGAIRDLLARQVTVEYHTSPRPVLGVELRAGDRKVGWSVGDRLDAAEREVAELLEATGASGETGA